MADKGGTDEILARGAAVRAILDNEAFQDEVNSFLDVAKNAWLTSQPHEWENRERLHEECNALRRFLSHLEGAVEAAEIEKNRAERKANSPFWRL